MVGGDRTSQAQGGAGGGKERGTPSQTQHSINNALTPGSHRYHLNNSPLYSTILLMNMTIQIILLDMQRMLDQRGLNINPKNNISVSNF